MMANMIDSLAISSDKVTPEFIKELEEIGAMRCLRWNETAEYLIVDNYHERPMWGYHYKASCDIEVDTTDEFISILKLMHI